jgi:hypothetical protein
MSARAVAERLERSVIARTSGMVMWFDGVKTQAEPMQAEASGAEQQDAPLPKSDKPLHYDAAAGMRVR